MRTKCMCCKEYGSHTENECYKDPNPRTGFDIFKEDDRINERKNDKKLFSDANIMTLNMLKELAKDK